MGTMQHLSTLALTQFISWAASADAVKAGFEGSAHVIGVLVRHFTDHSEKLNRALERSSDRAWRALEMALAGQSWWDRCTAFLVPAEARAFQEQVEIFLDRTQLSELVTNTQVRQRCWHELQAARKGGLLTGGTLDAQLLAEDVASLNRFSDPLSRLDAEWRMLQRLAEELRLAGHATLAWFVELRPAEGPSLLMAGMRYFFRREVETDQELFQGLTFTRIEDLSKAQAEGFRAIDQALAQHGARLEELLGDLHADVLDIKAEMDRHGQHLKELSAAVLQALDQHRLAQQRELRASDSFSIRSEPERKLVKALVGRYRSLPEEKRRELPALLNALAKLEVASGDLPAAQEDFRTVAALVPTDPHAQAVAHYNEYQAALEQRGWPQALAALRRAAELDPERFAPFPFQKYEPRTILGAGGFGVAFLCRHINLDSPVVIKALREDGLHRDVDELFAEARVLNQLRHSAIIGLRDCDYAGAGRTRPFLVMEYFEGQTLADHVARHGPLAANDLLAVARPVAEGLRAAHERKILHRDIKPGNLLVRKDGSRWRVKLIDFGLALKQDLVYASMKEAGSGQRSAIGSSVAGTLDYAAPEQLGRFAGVIPGPLADVYAFAKTCCYALFKTTQPLSRHWQSIPRPLARLLESCLEEAPDKRPPNFGAVLKRLGEIAEPRLPMREVSEESSVLLAQPAEESAVRSVQTVLPVPDDPPEVQDVLPAPDEPAPASAGKVAVHIVFPGQKAWLNGVVEVQLDGKPLGRSTIVGGLDLRAQTSLGTHYLKLQFLLQSRIYSLELNKPGSYEVRLRFDKVWNNFSNKVEVVHRS
jgi:serine/threonine protein kinase